MGCKNSFLCCFGCKDRDDDDDDNASAGVAGDEPDAPLPANPQSTNEPGTNNDVVAPAHPADPSGGTIDSDSHPRPSDYFKPPPAGKSTWDDDEVEGRPPKQFSPVRHSSPIPIPIPGSAAERSAIREPVMHVGSPPPTGGLSEMLRHEEAALKEAARKKKEEGGGDEESGEQSSDSSDSQFDDPEPSPGLSLSPDQRGVASSASVAQTLPILLQGQLPEPIDNEGVSSSAATHGESQQRRATIVDRGPHISFAENLQQRPRVSIGAVSAAATAGVAGEEEETAAQGGQSEDKKSSSSSSSSSSTSSSSSEGKNEEGKPGSDK